MIYRGLPYDLSKYSSFPWLKGTQTPLLNREVVKFTKNMNDLLFQKPI